MKISPINTPLQERTALVMSAPPASAPPSEFKLLFNAVSELFRDDLLQQSLKLKAQLTMGDMQKMLDMQSRVQKIHLGVEMISRASESVLSIARKVQNGQ